MSHGRQLAVLSKTCAENQLPPWSRVLFEGDLSVWILELMPETGPLSRCPVQCRVKLPEDFPVSQPIVEFSEALCLYHPNVDSEGFPCVDFLSNRWKPMSVCGLVTMLRLFLQEPDYNNGFSDEIDTPRPGQAFRVGRSRTLDPQDIVVFTNASETVFPTILSAATDTLPRDVVAVWGSWDGWTHPFPVTVHDHKNYIPKDFLEECYGDEEPPIDTWLSAEIVLQPGTYQYKFQTRSGWALDPKSVIAANDGWNANNVLQVFTGSC